VRDILKFHEKLMPSEKSLQHALKKVLPVPFTMIAPQHGSIAARCLSAPAPS
jgi:flavorubredoxin